MKINICAALSCAFIAVWLMSCTESNSLSARLPKSAPPLPDDTIALILTVEPQNWVPAMSNNFSVEVGIFRNYDNEFYIFPKFSFYATDGKTTILLKTFEEELSGHISPPYWVEKHQFNLATPLKGAQIIYATLEHSDSIYQNQISSRGEKDINYPVWRGKVTSNNIKMFIK